MINSSNIPMAGSLGFLFFSGELSNLIPVSSISDYISNYTPELNFYLVPVVVSQCEEYVY